MKIPSEPNAAFLSSPISMMASQPQQNGVIQPENEFMILGSGVSTGIPRISCIIRPREPNHCKVCKDANENPLSKNRRGNVSALVRIKNKTVLIDCGKTTRELSMRHFPKLGISNIDAIVLTHGHADAILGLDDARDIQQPGTYNKINGNNEWIPPNPTPVFLNQETMRVCENVFPYLVPQSICHKKDIPRRVAALSWNVFQEDDYFKPFYPLDDLNAQFIPIPMYHGGTYICMGFIITIKDDHHSTSKTIAYLSDLNDLPQKSWDILKQLPVIDLLVIDVLDETYPNRSHYSLAQATEVVKLLSPIKAVAVGMTCSIGLHEDVNQRIKEKYTDDIDFELAYDGWRYPC